MRYVDLTGSGHAAGRSIRMRNMARRLPQLVRRSLALAWRVDRLATFGLLLCQLVTGVMQALGLVTISGILTALLRDGDVHHRLLQAWPSRATLAGAAGVRALLGTLPPRRNRPAPATPTPPNLSHQARMNRAALAGALTTAGLINYGTEWWHWSFGDRYWALQTQQAAALYGPVELA